MSLQKLAKRAEHWVVVKDLAEVICHDKKITLKENGSTYIPLGYTHLVFLFQSFFKLIS